MVEVVHDLGGRIPPVNAGDVDGPLEAEGGAVWSARLNDPIGEQQHEITGLERDRGSSREGAVRENPEGRADAFQKRLHTARAIENEATGVAGTGVEQGTAMGVESSKGKKSK